MSSHYPSENTQGFASVLYVVFIVEKKFRVDAIAPQLDVSPSTLYEYIRGSRVFPPDLIAPLFRATRERRFLSFFLDEAEVVFHELPACSEGPDVELFRSAVHANEEFIGYMKSVMGSLSDGRVDRRELVEIERRFYEAWGDSLTVLACAKLYARKGNGR